jgi:hypothetical protein
LEALEILHDRMVGGEVRRPKLAAVVALELSADHLDPHRRIAKTKARAVKRHKALATADEVDDRRFALGRKLVDVGVDGQRVIPAEDRPIEVFEAFGVDQLDASLGKHRLELGKAVGGAMMPLVSEEEDAERPLGRGGRRNRPGSYQEPEGNQAEHPKTARAN